MNVGAFISHPGAATVNLPCVLLALEDAFSSPQYLDFFSVGTDGAAAVGPGNEVGQGGLVTNSVPGQPVSVIKYGGQW